VVRGSQVGGAKAQRQLAPLALLRSPSSQGPGLATQIGQQRIVSPARRPARVASRVPMLVQHLLGHAASPKLQQQVVLGCGADVIAFQLAVQRGGR